MCVHTSIEEINQCLIYFEMTSIHDVLNMEVANFDYSINWQITGVSNVFQWQLIVEKTLSKVVFGTFWTHSVVEENSNGTYYAMVEGYINGF